MRRMTDGLKDSFTIYVEQVNGDIFQVSVYNDRLPQGTMFDQVSDAPLCIQIDKAARAIVAARSMPVTETLERLVPQEAGQ